MKAEHFNKIVETRLLNCRNVLVKKADEYARGDRLSNFKAAGRIDEESPEKSLWAMWKKHIVSIMYLIDDIEAGKQSMPWEVWEEKFTDMINYAILLEGLIQERLFPEEDIAKKYDDLTKYYREKLLRHREVKDEN